MKRAVALWAFIFAALCSMAVLPRVSDAQGVARAGIAVSNRLTPAKDARVVRAALTPRAGWQPPYRWRITVGDTLRWSGVGALVTVVDTVGDIVDPCTTYRVTVRPVAARDSLTARTTLCRRATVAERAIRDSFPDAGTWLALCGARGDTITAGQAVDVQLWGRNRYTGQTRRLAGPACAGAP